MNSHLCAYPFLKHVFRALSLACGVLAIPAAFASDYSEADLDWSFKSGLDRESFTKAFTQLTKDGFRIADIESYRLGRSNTVSTIWTKIGPKDEWRIVMSKPITEFLDAHKKHQDEGFSLVEFEADRTGATLHFSGVWLKTEEGLDTEFYFGMESLEFSNRYGEMADRGYRLVDFEAYESNGKYRHSAVWMKNDEQLEVRFYRAIPKNTFGEVAASMREAGFRLIDVEGYQYEGDFVFAGEWVRMAETQSTQFAFDLLADEFYNKNALYSNDGYRLTEFEVYEDHDVVYYAGSWMKGGRDGAPVVEKPKEKKKASSLEKFRSDR
ncbi:hypothetical protein [Pelagicoccus sp. SDUM812003]|uniref:hypothetical protein n=1 Tax=Pelagicoccus sp. SDUM812003 TaxID=3041267 RepID=UPI00281067E0|nr:hypothetical protein [Pelagicoccus sp. SDUM812003]MDQ8205339.1 hypothetical protein [Pelagicoccus sp. SDUM812003]